MVEIRLNGAFERWVKSAYSGDENRDRGSTSEQIKGPIYIINVKSCLAASFHTNQLLGTYTRFWGQLSEGPIQPLRSFPLGPTSYLARSFPGFIILGSSSIGQLEVDQISLVVNGLEMFRPEMIKKFNQWFDMALALKG